jgi:MFS transporter, OFA family, oxalate/formate antiporter
MSVNDNVSPQIKKLPWFPWIGKKKPFFGWNIVASGAATQFTQGIANQGFSTYLSYLQTEFGWTKALMAGSRSISQVEGSILGPIQGILIDKFGPRIISLIGTIFMGLGLILFSTTHSLWMFYFSNIIIALGSSLQGIMTVSIAVNYWFRKKRTIAQSIMLVGFAMAGIIAVPIIVSLEVSLGWRNAALISGIFAWVIGIPCSLYLLRRPEPYGLLPDGAVARVSAQINTLNQSFGNEYYLTLKEAMHTPAFWLMGIGNALGMSGMAAVQTHIFLHLQEGVKLTPAAAALIWSITCIANIPARLLGGIIGDRSPKYIVLAAATLLMGGSILILGTTTSMAMSVVFALLFGIGWGCRTPVMQAIQGDYFGMKSLGVISGWLGIISLPFGIVTPVLAGYMADIQGNYRMAFLIISLMTIVGGVFSFLARPPRHPQRMFDAPKIS